MLKVNELEYASRPPRPSYPGAAKRLGQQGVVVVRVLIGQTGAIESVRIIRSSQHASLDQAAVQAMRAVTFKPYRVSGVARRAMADIPFNFVLR